MKLFNRYNTFSAAKFYNFSAKFNRKLFLTGVIRLYSKYTFCTLTTAELTTYPVQRRRGLQPAKVEGATGGLPAGFMPSLWVNLVKHEMLELQFNFVSLGGSVSQMKGHTVRVTDWN